MQMIWLAALLLFLSGAIAYLFFAPFYLEIDSVAGLLQFRFHRLAAMRLIFADGSLKILLQLPGWQKLITPGFKKQEAPTRRKKQQRPIPYKMLLKAIHSFKVNKCRIAMDTGDYKLDGMLYPVVWWAGRQTGKDIAINFCNETHIVLEIQNSAARIVWAILKRN